MTNYKSNNTHARKTSYAVLDLCEFLDENYETRERIKRKELVDLFAPVFDRKYRIRERRK